MQVTYEAAKWKNANIEPLQAVETWSREARDSKPRWPYSARWELQNKLKFVQIGSQEPDLALRPGKFYHEPAN